MNVAQHYVVGPLRGMDQRWRPLPTSAAAVRDMRWDPKDGWTDSGGFREITNVNPEGGASPFAGQGTTESLHWFAQHNGARQWLIWEDSAGRLRAFNGSNAPATPWTHLEDVDAQLFDAIERTRTVLTTPWERTQSQAWGGRFYLVNGFDEPLVFDGTKCERAGWFGPPGAPSAYAISTGDLNASAESDVAGAYVEDPLFGFGTGVDKLCGRRYRCSFVNERGQESPLSAASDIASLSTTTTNGYRGFIVVNLPTGGPECVARRLYATQDVFDADDDAVNRGYAETFFFHSEIPDNETVLVEDSLPDAMLGAAVDELDYGPWPTGSKFLAVFKNTMFIAGMVGNEIAFSAPGYPEIFPPDNRIPIGDDDMGPMTGWRATKNALVVFKQHGIYLIKGNPVSGFEGDTLSPDVGCAAGNTIRELPGLGLTFLDANGDVWLLEGALENTGSVTGLRRLSTAIPDDAQRINKSAIVNACGEVYHRDREYWLAVPTIGSAVNDRVLVYHYDIGEWSYRDDFPIACMVESHDQRGYLFFGSNVTTANRRGVLVYSLGWQDKGGTSIAPLYRSTPQDFGNGFTSVAPVHVTVRCVGYGDNDLVLGTYVNRSYVAVRPSTETAQGADQQEHSEPYAVYGLGLWGTARWGEYRPVEVVFDVSTLFNAACREFSVEFTPALRRLEVMSFDISLVPGAKRAVLPDTNTRGPVGEVT